MWLGMTIGSAMAVGISADDEARPRVDCPRVEVAGSVSVPKIVEVAVDVGIPCAGWAGGAIAGLLGSKCAPCAKPAGPALGIWVAPSDSPWAAWGP